MSKTPTGSAAARLIMSKRAVSTAPLHTTQLLEIANINPVFMGDHPLLLPTSGLEVGKVTNATQAPVEIPNEDPHVVLAINDQTRNSQEEELLTEKILELWSHQSKRIASAKRTRVELAKLRAELAENFYHLKKRYCRAGRDGEWSSFLKGNGISRTSADRYVTRHENSISSDSTSCPSGASAEPSTDDVTKLVKKLVPKLATLLVTPALAEHFLGEIVAATRAFRATLE
jgi:hypothetical protein